MTTIVGLENLYGNNVTIPLTTDTVPTGVDTPTGEPSFVAGNEWSNVLTGDSYRTFVSDTTGDISILFAVGEGKPITGIGLTNHNLTSIVVDQFVGDGTYIKTEVLDITFENERTSFFELASSTADYLLVTFECDDAVSIGMFWLGNVLELPRGPSGSFSRPLLARRWETNSPSGRNGAIIGTRSFQQTIRLTISLNSVSDDFLAGDWQDILDHCFISQKPIWYSWDTTNFQRDGFVGYPSSSPAPPVFKPVSTDVQMSLAGV